VAWCAEVNAAVHSEICAVPAGRLDTERDLLGALPSLRPEVGGRPTSRKVDKLSCVRFGSARYSVPSRLIGATVLIRVAGGRVQVLEPFTGEIAAEHDLVAPGEVAITDGALRLSPAGPAPPGTAGTHRRRETVPGPG
jgi:Mu transposase, C-terminal domain